METQHPPMTGMEAGRRAASSKIFPNDSPPDTPANEVYQMLGHLLELSCSLRAAGNRIMARLFNPRASQNPKEAERPPHPPLPIFPALSSRVNDVNIVLCELRDVLSEINEAL